MYRKQLIQLLQFVLARIVVRALVVFVLEKSFIDFVLQYRLYLLIVSVSYRYYYSIEYESDKKYNFIRKSLIYGNLYLFAHIFFRPLLNISHELFIVLWLMLLWLWGTTKIRSKRKIVPQIFWCIITFLILISWIIYLYPEAPDVEWFLRTKNYELSISWISSNVDKKDAFIQIQEANKSEEVQIVPNLSKSLNVSCIINYPSLQKERLEDVIVFTPEGDIIVIFPQSSVQLEFYGKKLQKVSQVSWKLLFFSGVLESDIMYEWENVLLDQEILDLMVLKQNQYKEEFIKYLKLQISNNTIDVTNNTMMYNIDGKILEMLSKLFPATFNKNLHNYNEFQKYFNLAGGVWVVKIPYSVSASKVSTNGLRQDIKNNGQIWKNKVYRLWK